MLRALVAAVLLLNLSLAALVWAVDQGHVVWPDAWRGVSREPERLARQIKPEAMVLKPADASKPNAPSASPVSPVAADSVSNAASSPAVGSSAPNASSTSNTSPDMPAIAASGISGNVAAPAVLAAALASNSDKAPAIRTLCLQSRDNESVMATKLSSSFKEQLPGATVQTFVTTNGGMWMVYMGKYADINAATKKMAEVKALKIPGDFALIRNTAGLQPGISLGAFRSKEAANTRLQEVGKKGVKTARVVEVTAPKELNTVKLPELDPAQRARADEIAKKLGVKNWEACAST